MYFLKRLLFLGPILILISLLAFALVRQAPGGPFDRERAPASPEIERHLRARYHLDEGFWSQYGRYLGGLLHGDLGPSLKYRSHTVNDILRQGLPVSMTLGILSFLFALGLGIPLGITTVLLRGRWPGRLASLLAMLAVCVPGFVVGPLLVMAFAVRWQWFPAALWESPWHVVLPTLSLGLFFVGKVARLMHEGLSEVWGADFITTARAKGLGTVAIVRKHALRPALLPVLSFSGPLLADLLTGSFVVENLFQIPGIGVFMVNSSLNRDYPMVVGLVLVYAVMLLVLNLLVDVGYGLLDRRVRHE